VLGDRFDGSGYFMGIAALAMVGYPCIQRCKKRSNVNHAILVQPLCQNAEHEDIREGNRVFTLVLSGWHKVKSAVDKRQTSDEVNSVPSMSLVPSMRRNSR